MVSTPSSARVSTGTVSATSVVGDLALSELQLAAASPSAAIAHATI
jgi:hypothetical protein